MRKIPLSGKRGTGKCAIVDDDMYPELSRYKWHLDQKGYARHDYSIPGGRGRTEHWKMHRKIMGMPTGTMVDHINGNKLDNRKKNLRLCKTGQNRRNSKLNKNNSSGYRGVYFIPKRGTYLAHICVDGTKIEIATFKTKEEAAYVRDQVALQLCPDFTKLSILDHL